MIAFKSENKGRPFFVLFDNNETIVELLTRYSYFLNSNKLFSPNSLVSYVQDVKHFSNFLSANSGFVGIDYSILFKTANAASVNDFLSSRKLEGKSDNTLRSCDRRLKYFFDWLYSFRSGESLNISQSPYHDSKLKTPRPYRLSKQFLTYIQIAEFLREFSSEHHRAFGHFMYDTGARVSEMIRVRVSDLPDPNDFPEDFLFYPIAIRGSKGRGGICKDRDCLISRIALNRTWRYFNNWVKSKIDLKQFKRNDIPVFFNSKGNPTKSKTVTDLYLRKSIKLISENRIIKNIHPHSFRHGAGYSIMMSNHGKDMLEKLLLAKRQLGHNQIKSTEVYATIPIDVLLRIRELNSNIEILDRYGEAQYIFDHTSNSK